jgi:hypothetical protein
MHFGTFPLADDGQDEPVTALGRELRARGVSAAKFWVLEFGEGRMVPEVDESPIPRQRAGLGPKGS